MSSGTPYTSGPHVVNAVGGQESFVEIRTPHRGTIETVRFDQIDGDLADCAFEVYTKSPTQLQSSSHSSTSSGEAGDGTIPISAYSIFGEKTYQSGTPFLETERNYSFTNRDGTSTNPVRKLYVRLQPAGVGPKRYVVTFEMKTSQLN